MAIGNLESMQREMRKKSEKSDEISNDIKSKDRPVLFGAK